MSTAVHQGLSHALALAALGVPVFPCRAADVPLPSGGVDPKKRAKAPLTTNGFKDASSDPSVIKELWKGRNANALVGYPTGTPSGIIVVDVDMSSDKGKDGWFSLDAAGLDPSAEAKHEYTTMSNGMHYLFSAPTNGAHVGNAQDLMTPSGTILPDVDRRGEGGYAIWYGAAPASKVALSPLPEWAARPTSVATGAEFNGTVEDWIAGLESGHPSPKTVRALSRIPSEFNYTKMLSLQAELIRLGAAAEPGIGDALATLRDAWLKGKWDTPSNRRRFANALISGIRKFGGTTSSKSRAYFNDKGSLNVVDLAEDIKHDVALGKDGALWVYQDGVWRPQDHILIHRAVEKLGNAYRSTNDKTIRNAVSALGLTSLPEVPNGALINLRNTMFDWKDGKQVAHSPQHLSTVQLPFDYDPNALCPEFDKWLVETVPADSLQLVLEVLGYLLMSGNPLQKAFLLVGPRGSGKSTLLRLIKALLGADNVSSSSFTQLTSDKFSTAELYGKIANLSGDNASSYLEDSSIFKQLTGEDTVQAARKFGQPFNFTCWATMIFSANEFWASKDTTDAYYERWTIVPFPNRVLGTRKLDEGLLHAEAPGIFNKAMTALSDLMARGHFDTPVTSAEAMEGFKEESDAVRRWLKSSRILRADPHDSSLRAVKEETYTNFKGWCAHEGIHNVLSARVFYSRLKALDYDVDFRSSGTRFVTGLELAAVGPNWAALAGAAV